MYMFRLKDYIKTSINFFVLKIFLTRIIKKNVFNRYLKLQLVLFNHCFFSYDNLLGRKNTS